MNDRTFAYAMHIKTTPEKLWEALTSNEFWQEYWGGVWRVESNWRAGSPLKFFTGDGKFFSQGEILESDPPKRLSYTWPNPEEQHGSTPPERLTWEINTTGPGTVMLKLVHDRLSDEYYQSVGKGWAKILSSLKTLLETGSPLAFHPRTG
jgi:uncharacterized protein YndB with AHSA1/START domain